MNEKYTISSWKKAKAKIDPKIVVLQEYHNFLDVFLKKNSDTFSSYQKYYYKIHLEKEQKLGHVLLYKMSPEKLNAIKQYLNFYLAKRFI